MLERIKHFFAKYAWARYALVLLAGIGIGALFYPTKHIEERERQRYEHELNVKNEEHLKAQEKTVEMYNSLSVEYRQLKSESENKITRLTSEVRDLKSKQKTAYYKVVRPDGTVEIQKFSETEVTESTKVITQIQEEFKQKVESIEQKWSDIHRERVTELSKEFKTKSEAYEKTIAELEKSKVVDINKKSFGLEGGLLTSGTYYGHATYDVFGPFFLGLHAQFGAATGGGGGIGIRF